MATSTSEKYIPVDYADDVDVDVFDYLHFGHTVFCPPTRWADCAQTNLIKFNPIIDNVEICTGLNISKGFSRSVHVRN